MLDYKNIIKSIKRRTKGVEDPRIMHATRDWFIAIVIFITIAIAGGVYIWLLYNSYFVAVDEFDPVTESDVPYQAALVEKAMVIINEKQQQFDQIISSNQSLVVSAPLLEEVMSDDSASTTDFITENEGESDGEVMPADEVVTGTEPDQELDNNPSNE